MLVLYRSFRHRVMHAVDRLVLDTVFVTAKCIADHCKYLDAVAHAQM